MNAFRLKEGAGGKQFPFGRWNRDQGHRGEILYDGEGCWACCSCGFQGDLRTTTQAADTDMILHERFVFNQGREGKRFVRGVWQ